MADKHLTITNVQKPGALRATFKDEPVTFLTWTFTAEAGGTTNPSGVQQVAQGSDLFITIIPDQGKVVDQVFLSIDGGPETEVATDD